MIAELERKNAELAEALRRAETASQAKSDFLANMSHELRTPLNAILGFADLMRAEVHGPLVGEYREYAADIRESGGHLLRIINDILDISKAEAGKMVLDEDSVDVGAVVANVCRLVRHRTEEARLEILSELAPGLPPLVADEMKLKQMLLNLVYNAVKFTPHGGSVRISADTDAAGAMTIAVSDTGIGIPAEQLQRVLEPFAQADGSRSRQYGGTGLGLPLVKAMVELHGGTLRLESMLGEGTVASLLFPAERSTR